MVLFQQGRRLGRKPVKFPFHKATGPNHYTFVLPHAGQDGAVHTSERAQGGRGVEMSSSLRSPPTQTILCCMKSHFAQHFILQQAWQFWDNDLKDLFQPN